MSAIQRKGCVIAYFASNSEIFCSTPLYFYVVTEPNRWTLLIKIFHVKTSWKFRLKIVEFVREVGQDFEAKILKFSLIQRLIQKRYNLLSFAGYYNRNHIISRTDLTYQEKQFFVGF